MASKKARLEQAAGAAAETAAASLKFISSAFDDVEPETVSKASQGVLASGVDGEPGKTVETVRGASEAVSERYKTVDR